MPLTRCCWCWMPPPVKTFAAKFEAFQKICPLTGLVMTKLDGTARGGMLVAVADEFDLPVHFVGVGEGLDDLQPFDARAFARSLAGLEL